MTDKPYAIRTLPNGDTESISLLTTPMLPQTEKDEALLRQALDRLEYAYDHMPLLVAHNIEATMEAIKERLNG